ncbi:MAG: CPBP family intramembrane metalloprotease [Prevotella sp.]|nr:CPBP family intramembrane metalloprotease [Prevotella sp.]
MKKYFDAILYIVAFLLIQFAVTYAVVAVWAMAEGKSAGAALSALTREGSPTIPQLIVIQVVSSVITLALFLMARWSRVSRSYLRSKPYGVLFWAAVAVIGTIIPSEVFIELVPLPDFSGKTLADIMGNRWGYLVVCIFAPVVEELVFRGAVLRVLLQGTTRHWGAIALSAALFALAHANPAQVPHAFCLGLLLGWMYYRTGSVIPGIMTHWVNNTVAYVVYNVFPQYADAKIIDLYGGNMLKVSLAVAISLCSILLPAIVQLNLRMKKTEPENKNLV